MDNLIEAVKSVPPVATGGLYLFGIPISEATSVLVGIYTAFLLYFLIRDKWWRQRGKPKD